MGKKVRFEDLANGEEIPLDNYKFLIISQKANFTFGDALVIIRPTGVQSFWKVFFHRNNFHLPDNFNEIEQKIFYTVSANVKPGQIVFTFSATDHATLEVEAYNITKDDLK